MDWDFKKALSDIFAKMTQADVDALSKDFASKVVAAAVRQLGWSEQCQCDAHELPAQPVFEAMGLDALPPFPSVKHRRSYQSMEI